MDLNVFANAFPGGFIPRRIITGLCDAEMNALKQA